MTETLRIDTGLVLEAGGRLQALAGAIPPPPAAFRPSGADPLSTAIAAKVAEVVDPVIAQLPVTKEDLLRYAQNVVNAAGRYDAVDRQLAEEILERLEKLDTDGDGAGGAGSGGSVASTAGPGAGASQQAAGGTQDAGQLGQMMQMPMQMAQQAAQIPMQLAGMAAAIPAAMMQGVSSAMQQVGQVSEMAGMDEQEPDVERVAEAELVEQPPEESEPPAQTTEAAPGTPGGERVPEPQRQGPQPEAPVAPNPAPTRPAESAPGIAL